eukprot:3301661-Rhodomonas_salina.1
MIKTHIVNRTESWLLSERRHDNLASPPSLPFTLVPIGFWYWALGRRYFSKHGKQCTYNSNTYMHEFAWSTLHFSAFFGLDLGHISPERDAAGISVESVDLIHDVR